MNLQKGLNRIFILLGLVAAGFGCKFGGDIARYNWTPSLQEAFQSINWNDQENINKYYLATQKKIEEIGTKRKARAEKKDRHKTYTGRNLVEEIEEFYFGTVKTEDLPNFKKSPPQYNEYVFRETFPDALKTPIYKVWIGIILGALFAFCLCYGGLHSIRLVIKWIISGFKDK